MAEYKNTSLISKHYLIQEKKPLREFKKSKTLIRLVCTWDQKTCIQMIMTVGNWKLFSGSIRKFPFKFLIDYRFSEFWGQSFNGREFPHQVISITLCQENQSQKTLKPKLIYWI